MFEDSAELAAQLAVDFNNAVAQKAASGEVLTVALSGGHTPKAFFEILAKAPYKEGLSWEKEFFFWVEERCLPLENAESIYKLTILAYFSIMVLLPLIIHKV